MDWGNVTVDDLMGAMKEVDWSLPPRPITEFFSKFSFPRSFPKWSSRVKCNLYYYRTNYFILFVTVIAMSCVMKPIAVIGAILVAISVAFLNDSFGITFSEKVTRVARTISPHLAAKMRPPHMPVIRGRPSAKNTVHICGRPRGVVIGLFLTVGLALWFFCGYLVNVCWALGVNILVIIVHASVRMPNLKARLNTFREEFRAVWRNYGEFDK